MSFFNNKFPLTSFGEIASESKTPQVQAKFPYSINTDIVQSLTNNASSSVSAADGLCTVTCAASAEAFSQIRTLDVVRYGPGQGAKFLGTCLFTSGVANSSQVFGPGDDDEGLFFGYNGTSFGVLHRSFGNLEVRSLEITAGADPTGGDFTITLDGTAVTVTVAASDTISEVVAAIVAKSADIFNAGRGWEVKTLDNVSVIFISLVSENATGTFSFADVSSGVTAGTFNQATTVVQGSAPTEEWTAQSSWNRDAMDGTGASGITIDPTMLNVFQIQWQYLGAGGIDFLVEDPEEKTLTLAHRIERAGSASTPTFRNPTLHLNMIAKTEAGYSGGALSMKTASMGGFIEGVEPNIGVRKSAIGTKTTTGTTPVNVLTLASKVSFHGSLNKIVSYPDFISIASEQTKTVTVVLCVNPEEVGGTPSLTEVDSNNSVIQYDTAGTTVTGGEDKVVFTLEGASSIDVSIKELGLFIRPGDRWVFTASASSGANADVTVAITWLERV